LVVFDPATKRKLVVYFDEPSVVLTPKSVREFILEAEAQGWTGTIRWDR